MATGDLTTLSHLKTWLGIPATSVVNDPQLLRLITQISRAIFSRISRSTFIATTYTDVYDGKGTAIQILKNWPVLSVSSVVVGATAIPKGSWQQTAQLAGYGWMLDSWDGTPPGNMQRLTMLGACFWQGFQNVAVTYRAGYQVTAEAQTIPATPFTIAPLAPYGMWAADGGVTFAATGAALTAIPSGVPIAGQYVPPNPFLATPVDVYTFAAADTGKAVLLTYSFIPADIEQATLEMIGERNSYRDRIGLRSKILAARETLSYDITNLPPWVAAVLQQYSRVVPL